MNTLAPGGEVCAVITRVPDDDLEEMCARASVICLVAEAAAHVTVAWPR